MRRRELLYRLFLLSSPSNFLPSSLTRSLSYFFTLSFSHFSLPFTLLITRRNIHEVLCIFDMSGGADYGGLIIDDDKNLTRKMFRGGKQRKHEGNVRLQRSGTFDSLELPISSIFRETCESEDKNWHWVMIDRKDFDFLK